MRCGHFLPLLLAGLLALSHSDLIIEYPKKYSKFNETYERLNPDLVDYPTPSRLIAPANTNFALSLYRRIESQSPGKNMFFSPFSITAGLAILSMGVPEDAQPQMLKTLGFTFPPSWLADIREGFRFTQRVLTLYSELNIMIGHTLVLAQNVDPHPDFTWFAEGAFNTKFLHTNFTDVKGTTRLINDHVKEQTDGKITNSVSGLSPDVSMALLNYIYFRGLWLKPFPLARVVVSDFHVDENTIVKVPMMVQDQREHWYLQDRRVPCSVLRMDYQGDALAYFILPQEGKMKEVEQKLTLGILERWNCLFRNRYFYKKIDLYLPKFSISHSYSLDQILPDLGFQNLFSSQADFSGINDEVKLKLSKSFHTATLHVNEIGTEAIASTSVSFSFRPTQHNHHALLFNRPFILMILSTSTRSVLFMGKVLNPLAP